MTLISVIILLFPYNSIYCWSHFQSCVIFNAAKQQNLRVSSKLYLFNKHLFNSITKSHIYPTQFYREDNSFTFNIHLSYCKTSNNHRLHDGFIFDRISSFVTCISEPLRSSGYNVKIHRTWFVFSFLQHISSPCLDF